MITLCMALLPWPALVPQSKIGWGKTLSLNMQKKSWVHLPWTFDALICIVAVAVHFYDSRKSVFQPPSNKE
jgi:hypothetical protein